jgi:hypothetical protein
MLVTDCKDIYIAQAGVALLENVHKYLNGWLVPNTQFWEVHVIFVVSKIGYYTD